ncbi:hypothetical protein ABZS86_33950 [Streptomyces sp. NPDC005355]|uniref:hypothetical protein n=1 Tax=Streptomyces sp. NPDC005355 TaxID=3157038 RepID=UPI0033AED1FA
MTREEREIQAARGRVRAQRMNERMRDHAKAELLGGLRGPPLSWTSGSGRAGRL